MLKENNHISLYNYEAHTVVHTDSKEGENMIEYVVFSLLKEIMAYESF